jgi:phage terminase large subunit-like protein
MAKPTDPVTAYARRVAAGKADAGRLHVLGCKRHLRDLKEQKSRGIWWDAAAALKAIEFFGHLRHYKGEWAGQPLKLEDWQQFLIGSCFGWKQAGDHSLRRFRIAFNEFCRGQGKSTIAAGLLIYGTFFDGEPGSDGFCIATKRDQSKIVFETCRRMVQASPALSKRLTVQQYNIHQLVSACKIEPLGADADTLDGLRPHIVVADEVHAMKTSDVLDVMQTGMGTRRQPLMFEITTAGVGQENVWFAHREYSIKVLEDIITDESWFSFIACADPEDDWRLESTWRKANPNYGVSVKPGYLAAECRKAQEMPMFQNAFRRLHCGQPTEQMDRAIDMEAWDACKTVIDWESFKGQPAYLGLDLANTTDIAAGIWLFQGEDGTIAVLPRFWVPEEGIARRSRNDRVPYQTWADQGFIRATPGNVIDYEAIRRDLNDDADRFALREAGFDPWNATQLATQLTGDGFSMVAVRQGYRTMSEPTKQLMALVVSKKFQHDGNPVLRWMASNMVVRQDPVGNVAPDKSKATEKIDGIVATIIGLSRLIVQEGDEDASSHYDDRGVLVI